MKITYSLKPFPFLVFIFLVFNSVNYSQTKNNDSILMVNLFNEMTVNIDKKDSVFTEIQKIRLNNNSLSIQDIYNYNLAVYYFRQGKLDSTIHYSKEGLNLYKEDSLSLSTAKYVNINGAVFGVKNDIKNAILEFKKGVVIYEKNKDYKRAAQIKNNISNMFFTQRDYESAYKYSTESYKTLKEYNDTINLGSVCAIRAISAIQLYKFKEGKILLDEGLKLSHKYNNPIGLIVGYFGKGKWNAQNKKFNEATKAYLKSLEYSELYRQNHYIILNKVELLSTYSELKNFKKAIEYGEDALKLSIAMQNNNALYSIKKKLGKAYFGNDNHKLAFEYLLQAHDNYLEISSAENKKIVNDVLIKYQTEKTEKELASEKLKIAESKIKLNRQKIWIIGLSSLLFILFITYLFYTRLQKQKLIQFKIDEEKKRLVASILSEEKERERISNELHDGVASSITAIKLNLENYNNKVNDQTINSITSQLGEIHKETRRISHNLMPHSLKNIGFIETLRHYCTENSSDTFKISFSNNANQDLNLNRNITTILYRAIQELINNSRKYAKSPICFVQVNVVSNKLTISVEDEGIGFDSSITKKSQGLLSVEKRIKEIDGHFYIESKINEGTLAVIELTIKK